MIEVKLLDNKHCKIKNEEALIIHGEANATKIKVEYPYELESLHKRVGIIAFYAVPGIVPADNIFTAILIGGASGLAATGTNQVFKQLLKKKDGEEESNGGTNNDGK